MFNLINRVLTICFLFAATTLFAQSNGINTSFKSENYFLVSEESNTSLTIENILDDIQFRKVNSEEGLYYTFDINDYFKSQEVGQPQLAVINKIIEIPYEASVQFNLLHSEYQDYPLSYFGISGELYPKQESSPKIQGHTAVFVKDYQTYNTDAWYALPLVKSDHLGNMRNRNLHRIQIAPIQYNPVKNEIRVYSKIKFEVVFDDGDLQQTYALKAAVRSPFFKFPKQLLLNEINSSTEETIVDYPVKYVIVADSMFQSTLQPFISWKKRKGFKVIEAYLGQGTVGTTATSVKSYLQTLYNAGTPTDPSPSYILLIGDVAQLPSHQMSGHVSDLPYAEYNNDHFPEVYYGRFPAVDTTELAIMLEKSLHYEMYTMSDPSYLDRAVLVAGVDNSYGPTHANGQINYIHQNYFDTTNGWDPKVHLYPASSSQANMIRNEVSEGVGIVNYTAHGSYSGWASPAFTVSHVASLNNADKYPLVITNACSTSEFDVAECFGEAMIRGDQKGALGYIGGSDLTYWDEDYYWAVGVGSITANQTYAGTTLGAFDKLFHQNGEEFQDWYTTQAQVMMGGNMTVSSSGSNLTNYYWEIYHLFGDPSLMVYLGVPSPQTPVYSSLLPLGVNQFQVNCDPYSYVALSLNDTLLGAGLADSTGSVLLSIGNNTQVGTAELVITGQNLQPYFGSVFVSTPNGPFITYIDHEVNDANGNNDGRLDFGEQAILDLRFGNLTSFAANSITAKLRTNDPNINIIDSTVQVSLIQGLDTVSLSSAFEIQIAQNCPDNKTFQFQLEIEDNVGNVWNTVFYEKMYSAEPGLTSIHFDDASGGNNNSICEAGESGIMEFVLKNLGHTTLNNLNVSLQCNNPFVTVTSNPMVYSVFKHDTSYAFDAQVQFASNTFLGTVANFVLTISNSVVNETINFKRVVGVISEDFNSGDFSKFNWQQSGVIPWVTDSTNKFEGKYSAKSGLTPDNSSSVLQLDLHTIATDSIRFHYKVSSEAGYDFLNFKIDGLLRDQWSGNKGWNRVAFEVDSGLHLFEWEYAKDYYLSDGQDCAWIDYILFPMTDIFESVEENENELTFSLYPNPTRSEFNVQFELLEKEYLNFGLFNLIGQQINQIGFSGMLTKGQHTFSFDLKGLNPGVYLFVVNTDTQHKVQKIIVTQ